MIVSVTKARVEYIHICIANNVIGCQSVYSTKIALFNFYNFLKFSSFHSINSTPVLTHVTLLAFRLSINAFLKLLNSWLLGIMNMKHTLYGQWLVSHSQTAIFSFDIWMGKIGSGILNSNIWFQHPQLFRGC